jgi:hypothetical protein
MNVIVSGRAVGSRRALFDDWSVPLNPDDFGGGEGLTLGELIEKIVHAEVQAYEQRREARRLDRVMSAAQIERGAAQGKVSPEGKNTPPAPNADEAVDVALQAFEDGLYLVAIDGREAKSLDETVFINAGSRVTFIRLVFLAGA